MGECPHLAHLNAHPTEAIRPVLPSLDRSSADTTVPSATGLAAGYDLTWILGAATDQAAREETGRSELTVASKTRTVPSWSDVKARLAQFDRAGLISLLGDLHDLSRDNQAFLNSRLGLGADPLAPYKKTISRWIYPDLWRNQDISVAKAKRAIADYRKAIGLPDGVAELSVFYCEMAAKLAAECGLEDERFFVALVRMFDQALVAVLALADGQRKPMLDRLNAVRSLTEAIGWGVTDAMNELWAEHVNSD